MKTETMIHVGGRIYLPVDKIYLLKAELNYTKIFLNDGSNVLSSTNLGKIEKRLSGYSFVRPNRSTVISWHFIHIVEMEQSRIILKNREMFSISRKRKKLFSNLHLFTKL